MQDSHSITKKRILGRALARTLTAEEQEKVNGAAFGSSECRYGSTPRRDEILL